MAGSSVNGVIDLTTFSTAARLEGVTQGIGVPFVQWELGNGGAPGLEDVGAFRISAGGAATASESAGTASVPEAIAGQIAYSDVAGFGQDWFERIHILPRTKVDFGNIITLVEEPYQIHSAFRSTNVTLSSITNNASPGTQFPNLTVPTTVYPLETLVDTTSTTNDSGAFSNLDWLGVLVKLKMQATQDGLPIFDTDIVFEFSAPANDVELLVKGQRLVLLPQVYESPATETLAWLTDIIESINGTEQRIALRKQPRQLFEVTYLLDGNDRQRMQALLFDWMDNVFGFPLWHERVFLTSSASVGATSYTVSGADLVDFRVGGLAVVFTNSYTYDVIEIASLSASTIGATSASLNAYPVGTMLVPLRTVLIRNAVGGKKYLNNLEEFSIQFEVTDNDTGALTGSTTPGFWSTYNSRVLFDDPNIASSSGTQHQYSRRVYRIDNQTGRVTQNSVSDRGKRGFEKGFVLRSRADLLAFRRLLISLRGRQKAFYLPTFSEDLTVVANLSSGGSTMQVNALEYVRLVKNRMPMSILKVTFTDGTSLVRSVVSSSTISASVEQLTLNTTWPSTKTPAEVSRVQFYELVRFDSDEIRIVHERIGSARATVPVLRVFDDN